jgi:broad specificity polyphosphatase/5'/3'-nucleotidase SurE
MSDSWLLLTNDDGIEARPLQMLIVALLARGHKVAVLAPSENHSATGMKLSLGKPLGVRERTDLCSKLSTEKDELYMFELDGTPCDTVITALDGGLEKLMSDVEVKMVISGINIGPNLSQDTYHSGTIAAAREAGLYGMPALACSWSSFNEEGVEKAVEATIPIIEACLALLPDKPVNLRRPHVDVSSPHLSDWPTESQKAWSEEPVNALRTAFQHGEMILNVNVPPEWNGKYATTRLGMRWYRGAVVLDEDRETSTFTIGAASIDYDPVERGDCDADIAGFSSITCLPSWPVMHPLALDERLLAWCLENSQSGMPVWLHN